MARLRSACTPGHPLERQNTRKGAVLASQRPDLRLLFAQLLGRGSLLLAQLVEAVQHILGGLHICHILPAAHITLTASEPCADRKVSIQPSVRAHSCCTCDVSRGRAVTNPVLASTLSSGCPIFHLFCITVSTVFQCVASRCSCATCACSCA